MPKVLQEFPKVTRPGRKPKHPYSDWFKEAAEANEGIQLTRGEDFEAEVRTMRHNLYRYADKENLEIETVTLITDDSEGIALRVAKATKSSNNSGSKAK